MNDRARVALALAAGYYLGRRHKLRLAVTLAAAGVARGLRRGDSGGLLKQGMKVLGTSPQIEEMTNRLRGDLMEVGKAAAVAAASRQLDSLTTRLHERAETLRRPGGERGEEEEDERGRYGDEDRYDEEDRYEDEYEEEPEPRPQARRPVTRSRRPAAGTSRGRG